MPTKAGAWALVLTNSQRLALVDLILEHMATRQSTSAFLDLSENRITKPIELLEALDGAKWFGERPESRHLDSLVKAGAGTEP
jgi:hypothetical protein